MKTAIAIILMLAGLTAYAEPTTNLPIVMLAWDRVTDPTVNAYGFYYGGATRTYTNRTVLSPESMTTHTVSNLVRGVTYYFAVTSLTTNGLESLYSAEVSYTANPLPSMPTNFTLTVIRL